MMILFAWLTTCFTWGRQVGGIDDLECVVLKNIVAFTNQNPLFGPWVDIDRDHWILGTMESSGVYLQIKIDELIKVKYIQLINNKACNIIY
jgi:hypothetical protein